MPSTLFRWRAQGASFAPDAGSPALQWQGPSPTPTTGPEGQTAVSWHGACAVAELDAQSWGQATQWALNVVLRVTAPLQERANLLEATGLPVALWVAPAQQADRVDVGGAVQHAQGPWQALGAQADQMPAVGPASPAGATPFELPRLGQWFKLSLVFVRDGLLLCVDDRVCSASAWPVGLEGTAIAATLGHQVFIGRWVDGQRWPFQGELASVEVLDGLNTAQAEALALARWSPRWALRGQELFERGRRGLQRQGGIVWDDDLGACMQPCEAEFIVHSPLNQQAYLMGGAIAAHWRHGVPSATRRALGGLLSDEVAADPRRPGSRASLFAGGRIEWSEATGAHAVTGAMAHGQARVRGHFDLGLPLDEAQAVAGGWCQRFQGGHLYAKRGAVMAFEVHGAILDKYLATGGPAAWGWPTTDETAVLDAKGGVRGQASSFDGGAHILWSPRTEAALVYGSLRRDYLTVHGGPAGPLGFPLGDEADAPGAGAGQRSLRMGLFEGGALLWWPDSDTTTAVLPVRLFLESLDTKDADGGIFRGAGSDVSLHVTVTADDGRQLVDEWIRGGTDTNAPWFGRALGGALQPRHPNERWVVCFSAFDREDMTSSEDMGELRCELHAGNAWGRRWPGQDLPQRGTRYLRRVLWGLPPAQPEPARYWGFINYPDSVIHPWQFAQALSDVDADWAVSLNPLSYLEHALEMAYYEAVVRRSATPGICFGMNLTALRAWHQQLALGGDLSVHGPNPAVSPKGPTTVALGDRMAVQHVQQCGFDVVRHVVRSVCSLEALNAKVAVRTAVDCVRTQTPCLLTVMHADFGQGHSLLVVGARQAADGSGQIELRDPNVKGDREHPATTMLTIDAQGRWNYSPFAPEGTTWGDHHALRDIIITMPWSLLSHRPALCLAGYGLLLLEATGAASGAVATQLVHMVLGGGTSLGAVSDGTGARLDTRLAAEAGAGRFVPAPLLSQPVDAGRIDRGHIASPTDAVQQALLRPLQSARHWVCELPVGQAGAPLGQAGLWDVRLLSPSQGPLQVGWAFGLDHWCLRADVPPQAELAAKVQVPGLGGPGALSLALSGTAQTFKASFQATRRLGLAGGQISLHLEGLQAAVGQSLTLALDAAGQGLTVVGHAAESPLSLSVLHRAADGSALKANWALPGVDPAAGVRLTWGDGTQGLRHLLAVGVSGLNGPAVTPPRRWTSGGR